MGAMFTWRGFSSLCKCFKPAGRHCRSPLLWNSSWKYFWIVDLASHPWVVAVCNAILGPDYKIVEIGFDVPNPGSADQPWHRDFPAPDDTISGRRLNSLAFNLTTVDAEENIRPFVIAPRTQWDLPIGFQHDMFRPKKIIRDIMKKHKERCPLWAIFLQDLH